MLRGRTARRILSLLGVVVLVQGLVLAASLPRSSSPGAAGGGLEPIARTAPDFRWEHPDGSTATLADLRGRPVLIHFWATWCPTCRAELPSLLDYAEDAPVEVVAVSLDDRWGAVLPMVSGSGNTLVARSTSADAARAFGTRSVPETWLVDADGRLRAHLGGAGDWSSNDLRDAVTDVLGAGLDVPAGNAAGAGSEPRERDGCEFPEPPATEC